MNKKPAIVSVENMKKGLMIESFRKKTSEPCNYVLGMQSHTDRFIGRKQEYIWEIERVLQQLELTIKLIEGASPDTHTIQELEIPIEDLIVYYQGVIFDLVHQLKDKLLLFIKLFLLKETPANPTDETSGTIEGFIKQNKVTLDEAGITHLLAEWTDKWKEGVDPIGTVLRKRTIHHHSVGVLHYTDYYQKSKVSVILDNGSDYLTEQGKEMLTEMVKINQGKIQKDAVQKAHYTLDYIIKNVSEIFEKLLKYQGVAITDEKIVEAFNEYERMLKGLEIKNNCTTENLSVDVKELIDSVQKELVGKDVEALYLVGSAGRADFCPGKSDINLYLVVNEACMKDREKLLEFLFSSGITAMVFSKKEFLSNQCLKYRFICSSDGDLLLGKELIDKKEEFFKPGLDLAVLLNEDFNGKYLGMRHWFEEVVDPTPSDIAKMSKVLAKDIIHLMYGVVMTNTATFTSSRQERVNRIKATQPKMVKGVHHLDLVIQYGVGTKESFKVLLDAAKHYIKTISEKLTTLQKEISEQKS